MDSHDGTHFQVHANVNSEFGDSALRLTITFYDENGHSTAVQTWRRHVRTLQMDGAVWQAYSAATELCKMMGENAAGHTIRHDELDTPLF